MALTARILLSAALILTTPASPAVLCASETPSRAGWNGIRSPNFFVIGDTGARDLKEVARRLEQFREAIGALFPKVVLSNATPTTVIVFGSEKSYDPVKPLYDGKARTVAGYFQPGPTTNYITFTTAHGIDQIGVIYHEYVHLLVNNSFETVPVWFGEGLAEYYRTFEVSSDGDQATLGRIVDSHVLRLRREWLPLESLVQVDHSSPLYNEHSKASVFYAESWVLLHYLLLGNGQKYAEHAGAFVAALLDRVPLSAAAERHLGISVTTLEKELRNYVLRDTFTLRHLPFSERIALIAQLTVTPVSEMEVHAILGDLLLDMNRLDESRVELNQALALDDRYGPAHATLGALDARAKQWEAARQHLEKAIASPSATFLCFFTYALALSQAPVGPAARSEQLERQTAIERALQRAIELNPSFPDAFAQLAQYRGRSSDGASEALRLIKRAIALAPGRQQYWLVMASVLVKSGDYQYARAALERVMNGSDELVTARARQFMNAIDDYEKRRADWVAGRPGRDDASPPAGMPGWSLTGLRPLQPGESRVFGMLVSIECSDGIVLSTIVDGTTLRARAASFEAVQFFRYRDDLSGQIRCGARTPPDPIFLTVRLEQRASDTATVVAAEFVPSEYKPE